MKVEKKKRKSRIPGYLLSAGIFLALTGIFAGGIIAFGGKTQEEEANTLRKALARASVQCYAIEGRYPPSVEYLEQYYGVHINREKFHVFYSGFASNVMPDITIVPARDQEDRG